MSPTLADLRRFALSRSLFAPTTLARAVTRLGFVQADPIRAPARAQDWTLFHRVKDYRAGLLEQRYPRLALEEDHFVNYGFVTRELQALMHPRTARRVWDRARWTKAEALHAFVRARGVVHPREVEAHFAYGTVKNWFGGSSHAGTQLLDGMHYRGLLRVARREGGTRCYEASELHERPHPVSPEVAFDQLLDAAVALYAPLPARTLGWLASALARTAAPQWGALRAGALRRAKERLASTTLDGVVWYWPATERPTSARAAVDDRVRLLAPFDPVVWDRLRFELFWGWAYRFEAYTPAAKRKLGYYALPLLWRDQVIGWASLTLAQGRLEPRVGFVTGSPPRERAFKSALDAELGRIETFLGA